MLLKRRGPSLYDAVSEMRKKEPETPPHELGQRAVVELGVADEFAAIRERLLQTTPPDWAVRSDGK